MARSTVTQSAEGAGVEEGFSLASRIKEPSGRFHQVNSLAGRTLEPPSKVAGSVSQASMGLRLRQFRMDLTDNRSATVTTGLSVVIDLERLSSVATRIAATAPERTKPTSPLNHVGSAHLAGNDARLGPS